MRETFGKIMTIMVVFGGVGFLRGDVPMMIYRWW